MSPLSSTFSSPRTSITVGRSYSPPDRRSSTTSTAHSSPFTITLKDMGLEEGLPGPGPSASKSARFRPKSLRSRRTLTQAIGAGAMMVFTGWCLFGATAGSHLAVESIGSVASDLASVNLGELVLPFAAKVNELDSWGLKLKAGEVLGGLSPWPPNPPMEESQPALSSLGREADEAYNLGPSTLDDYRAQMLEFVSVAFPLQLAKKIRPKVEKYLAAPGDEWEETQSWEQEKKMWQTAKNHDREDSNECKTWKGDNMRGWEYQMVDDEEAAAYVKKKLDWSRMQMVWDALPSGILHSDMLRYLLLALEGGIYSDTDTLVLKEPHRWGSMANLYRDGDGWMSGDQKTRIANGEDQDTVLGKPSLVVGIEADVGDRGDWAEWWPRPLQIAQWTMAAAPFHPVSLSALLRVTHATATAVAWAHQHAHHVKSLKDLGRYDDSANLVKVNVLDEPRNGGPLGVMQWTGPSVWSDAVIGYLRAKYGLVWPDLKDLKQPLRVGDVVILPVTGFSPGVGNFGAGWPWDAQAMVEHKFAGSWKDE